MPSSGSTKRMLLDLDYDWDTLEGPTPVRKFKDSIHDYCTSLFAPQKPPRRVLLIVFVKVYFGPAVCAVMDTCVARFGLWDA